MSKMKNSGVEWIGEIPEDWNVIRFKDKYRNVKEIAGEKSSEYERLALTLNGVIKRPKDDSEGLQPKDFDGYQILRDNDFVFKMIDLQNISTSRVGLSPYTGLVSPAYIRFSAKNKNEYTKYTYYYLMSMYYNCVFNSLGGDGVRSALNASDMGNLKIPMPSLESQKAIVDAIESKTTKIDALISNEEKQIEKLKAYKQALITETVTKGLDKNVKMKDSGVEWIGEIPEGWEIYYPKALFKQRKERAMTGDKQLTASQQYGIMNQKEYMEITGSRVVVVEKDFDILKHVEKGDFVLSMRSFQGGLEYSEVTGCISSAYVMLIPYSEKVYSPYFKWLLKSSVYINAIQSTSNLVRDGQAMRFANFIQIWLPCPPQKEQKAIAEFLDKKCKQIEILISKKLEFIEKLNTYKKSLIYEYVTGKKQA